MGWPGWCVAWWYPVVWVRVVPWPGLSCMSEDLVVPGQVCRACLRTWWSRARYSGIHCRLVVHGPATVGFTADLVVFPVRAVKPRGGVKNCRKWSKSMKNSEKWAKSLKFTKNSRKTVKNVIFSIFLWVRIRVRDTPKWAKLQLCVSGQNPGFSLTVKT